MNASACQGLTEISLVNVLNVQNYVKNAFLILKLFALRAPTILYWSTTRAYVKLDTLLIRATFVLRLVRMDMKWRMVLVLRYVEASARCARGQNAKFVLIMLRAEMESIVSAREALEEICVKG